MRRTYKNCESICKAQRGMSLLEMVLASAILLVGILSVVQLVPATLQSDLHNRLDTMATVIAQRELDQMLAQPLNLSPPTFTDRDGNSVSLGGTGSPGAPVTMYGSTPVIDFSVDASSVPDGFIIPAYQDPNDPNFPNGPTFEVRWAVIPQTTNGIVVSKRIIIGCRQTHAATPMLPVNLDSSVQK
jgi:prepilin-type N-terminal cleavage/methylation domain-containing protein